MAQYSGTLDDMACPDGSFGPGVARYSATLDDMTGPDGSFGPGVAQYSGTLDDMASPDGSFGPVAARYPGTLDDMVASISHLVRLWLDTQRHRSVAILNSLDLQCFHLAIFYNEVWGRGDLYNIICKKGFWRRHRVSQNIYLDQ